MTFANIRMKPGCGIASQHRYGRTAAPPRQNRLYWGWGGHICSTSLFAKWSCESSEQKQYLGPRRTITC